MAVGITGVGIVGVGITGVGITGVGKAGASHVLSHQMSSHLPPKPHFGGPFNAKPIIQRALRQLHVNGATALKLYGCIGIDKYLGVRHNFFR